MDKYRDFFPNLALGAALLLAAAAAAPLFARVRLPGPAAFLAIGILAGALGIAPTGDLSSLTLERVGAVALFIILFKGGLDTGFERRVHQLGPSWHSVSRERRRLLLAWPS